MRFRSIPNVFIVGAPKSGTTFMDQALRQHPEIYMPARKDLSFFGSDLGLTFTHEYGRKRETLDQYLRFFEGARGFDRIGESSVWYLLSKNAAREIWDLSPDSQIIVMLREPSAMLYSQHSQFLSNLNEDIQDFEEALAAEPDRRKGRRIPRTAHFPSGLLYRETARYAEQLQRYFEIFGQDRVHVILYDDFQENTALEVKRVFRFLNVDDSVEVSLDVVNPNKVIRNRRLHALAMSPPSRLEDLYHAMVPRWFHGRIAATARKMSLKHEARPPLDIDTQRSLQRDMAQDVWHLARLLNRDLSGWFCDDALTLNSSRVLVSSGV